MLRLAINGYGRIGRSILRALYERAPGEPIKVVAINELADAGTVLEICPTSNLHTRAVRHLEEFRYILATFLEGGVRFTINTDGTYLCSTNLRREMALLTESGILSADELEQSRSLAFDASFIR